MLRQLNHPHPDNPASPLVKAAALQRADRAAALMANTEAAVAAMRAQARMEAEAMREQAAYAGFEQGCVQAFAAVVPVLTALLSERDTWLESLRRQLRAQLRNEFERLEFAEAQLLRWCELQSEHGAASLSIYIPESHAGLATALRKQPALAKIRVELANVTAPTVVADDLVFLLQPEDNLPVERLLDSLAPQIDAFVRQEAANYLSLLQARLVAAPAADAAIDGAEGTDRAGEGTDEHVDSTVDSTTDHTPELPA